MVISALIGHISTSHAPAAPFGFLAFCGGFWVLVLPKIVLNALVLLVHTSRH